MLTASAPSSLYHTLSASQSSHGLENQNTSVCFLAQRTDNIYQRFSERRSMPC
jgi:hypothetical protein